MKGLEQLRHSEHMTEDEIGLHDEQFHQDLALLQHQQRVAAARNPQALEWCEGCGNEIPEARRKAVPGVALCVDCQRAEEIREKCR